MPLHILHTHTHAHTHTHTHTHTLAGDLYVTEIQRDDPIELDPRLTQPEFLTRLHPRRADGRFFKVVGSVVYICNSVSGVAVVFCIHTHQSQLSHAS